MTSFTEAIEAARRTGDLDAVVRQVPYAAFLGLSLSCEDGEYLGRLAYRDENVGNATLPALHGGTIGALLESVAVFEVLMRIGGTTIPRTINLTVDYLRSGKPVQTLAVATIGRQGKRVASVQAVAWQEDRGRPIATAQAHLLVD